MSTNSMIGLIGPIRGALRAVYCHSDGYIGGVGMALAEIIRRESGIGDAHVLDVVSTIMDHSWSMIDPDEIKPELNILGNRGKIIHGYGLAYTTGIDQMHGRVGRPNPDALHVEFGYLVTAPVDDVKSFLVVVKGARKGGEYGWHAAACIPITKVLSGTVNWERVTKACENVNEDPQYAIDLPFVTEAYAA